MAEVKTALEQVANVQPLHVQPSIAVLPFSDMSPAKDNEYFSDGLAEEIINALTRISGLRVIARTSAFAFKGQSGDIRKIADALSVTNILEGSVRKAGNRVRVTVQLIGAADGSHLWSERYDRDMTDIFGIQDEISQAIVEALKVKLGRHVQTDAAARQPDNPVAYRAFLEGRYYLYQATPAGMRRAQECFEHAIRVDPAYAPAHAALAEQIYWETIYLGARPREVIPAAFAAIDRALHFDPVSGTALALRGAFRAFYEYNWKASGEDFARAIEVDPRNLRAHALRAAWWLLPLRHSEEGLSEVKRALDLDPINIATNTLVVWCLYATGREVEALASARRMMELFPGQWTCCNAAAQVFRSLGLLDEAASTLKRGLELNPGNDNMLLGSLAHVRGLQGESAQAEKIRAQLEHAAEQGYVPLYNRAQAYEGCGDYDRAYQLLDQALDEREPMALLFLMARRAELESDPRYHELLRKMNLS